MIYTIVYESTNSYVDPELLDTHYITDARHELILGLLDIYYFLGSLGTYYFLGSLGTCYFPAPLSTYYFPSSLGTC